MVIVLPPPLHGDLHGLVQNRAFAGGLGVDGELVEVANGDVADDTAGGGGAVVGV